jgi:hypothetical protein
MNKENKEIYEDLPIWKREENISPAIRNLIELNTPDDAVLKKKLEELHSEIASRLEKLLRTKSVEEKSFPKTIHLVLQKGFDLIRNNL